MNKISTANKILLLSLSLLSLWILSPFILPIIFGVILAILATPLNKKIKKLVKSNKISAALISIGVGLFILLPLGGIIVSGTSDLAQILPKIDYENYWLQLKQVWVNNSPVIQEYAQKFGYDLNKLLTMSNQIFQKIGTILLGFAQTALKQIPNLIFSLFIVLASLFLSLYQGEKINKILKLNPWFKSEETDQIISSIREVSYSVVFAALVAGILQMIIMSIAAAIAGYSQISLIAVGTFFLSFVPVIGTAPITLSLILYSYFTQDYSALIIFLLAIGGLTFVDNILKPLIIGNKTKLHPFLAFLSALGGLSLFGFYGLFLGPIVLAILLDLFSVIWSPE